MAALRLGDGLALYFARHGETQGNSEQRYQGRTRDSVLTSRGEAQAAHVGAVLKHHLGPDPALACVCSPLQRARTTMEIARIALELPREGYAIDERVTEINLGRYEGLTRSEAQQRYPEAWRARAHDKWNVAYPGGENYVEVAARAEDWIASLRADTFAVTHGGFTRVLRGLFGGLDWKGISALGEPQGCVFRVRGSAVERLDS